MDGWLDGILSHVVKHLSHTLSLHAHNGREPRAPRQHISADAPRPLHFAFSFQYHRLLADIAAMGLGWGSDEPPRLIARSLAFTHALCGKWPRTKVAYRGCSAAAGDCRFKRKK